MDLDKAYIFVFVRQDMFNWQQMVAVGHAALEMGMELPGMTQLRDLKNFRPTGHPNLIVVGQPNEDALEKVKGDLTQRKIAYTVWSDPDEPEMGCTSVITEPMTARERNLLHHYRPWSERNNAHAKGEG